MNTLVTEHRRGELAWISLQLLEEHDLRHGFTLRPGGVSTGNFSSLNFSVREGDEAEHVAENWRRLEEAAGVTPGSWALLSQVHGDEVASVREGRDFCLHRRSHPRADAVVAVEAEVVAAVLTADCLPVIIASPGARAVAIAHAGWKGTLAGIAAGTTERLSAEGGVKPGEMIAGLGPAIGECCYEVGEDIYRAFLDRWGESFTSRVFTGKAPRRLDLQEANRLQLIEAGVKEDRIALAPFCTSCQLDIFYSHRRDGKKTGRMLNFVAGAGGVK